MTNIYLSQHQINVYWHECKQPKFTYATKQINDLGIKYILYDYSVFFQFLKRNDRAQIKDHKKQIYT